MINLKYEESFDDVRVYLEDFLFLHDAPKNLSLLIYELLFESRNQSYILINSFIKAEIAKRTGLSKGTIDNALTKLTECRLLIRKGRGVYEAHEGLLKSRELSQGKSVHVHVTYQDKMKTIEVEKRGENTYDDSITD